MCMQKTLISNTSMTEDFKLCFSSQSLSSAASCCPSCCFNTFLAFCLGFFFSLQLFMKYSLNCQPKPLWLPVCFQVNFSRKQFQEGRRYPLQERSFLHFFLRRTMFPSACLQNFHANGPLNKASFFKMPSYHFLWICLNCYFN